MCGDGKNQSEQILQLKDKENMMDKRCKICGKERDLFPLEFRAEETDAGEPFTVYVCGSCWETIAGIARRVLESIRNQELSSCFRGDKDGIN